MDILIVDDVVRPAPPRTPVDIQQLIATARAVAERSV